MVLTSNPNNDRYYSIFYRIVKKSILRLIFCFGLLVLPIVFWPQAEVSYEVPKVWFFQRWVEILGVLAILGILRGEGGKKSGRGKISLVTLVGFFVLMALASSLLGVDLPKSIWGNYYRRDGLLTLFHQAGLFYLLVLFWEKDWERDTALAIAGGSLAVSCWTIVVWVLKKFGVFGFIGGSMFGKAVGGVFGNPNFLAGYLLVGLPITVYFIQEIKQFKRVKWILPAMQITAIGLSGSRAGVWGVLVYLGIILTKFKRKRLVILGFLGLLVFFSNLGFLSYSRDKTPARNFFPESRQRIIIRGFRGFLKRPILGWGVANFDYAFESNFWPMKYENDVYVDQAHANILEVLVTRGMAGFAVYLTIILLTLKKLIAAANKSEWHKTLLIVFLLFLFHAQTNIISINEEMFFWLIVGITAGR